MKILSFFYFLGSFLPSWIRIRNLYADPDPDPAAQINTDPSGYGSGSETLVADPYVVESVSVSGSGLFDSYPGFDDRKIERKSV